MQVTWHQMLGVKMVAPSNELVARTNNVNHAVELGRLAGPFKSGCANPTMR
jgi:hypothetical protein